MLLKYGIETPDDLIESTLDYLKCHPYYSQLAAQQLFIYYQIHGTIPTLDQLIEAILDADRSYLDKVWEDLSSSKEDTLLLLTYLSTRTQGVYGYAASIGINAGRAIKKLSGLGVLYKDEGGYQFYDPMLQHYVAHLVR